MVQYNLNKIKLAFGAQYKLLYRVVQKNGPPVLFLG